MWWVSLLFAALSGDEKWHFEPPATSLCGPIVNLSVRPRVFPLRAFSVAACANANNALPLWALRSARSFFINQLDKWRFFYCPTTQHFAVLCCHALCSIRIRIQWFQPVTSVITLDCTFMTCGAIVVKCNKARIYLCFNNFKYISKKRFLFIFVLKILHKSFKRY